MMNGLLYLDHAGELWASDGTDAGTQELVDVRPGPAGSNPSSLQVVGNRLYFRADPGDGRVRYVSDGTVAGTVVDPAPYEPTAPRVLGGGVIAVNQDALRGIEPVVFDPVTYNATVLADLNDFSPDPVLQNMRAAGASVYFQAAGKVWRTDGSAAQTLALLEGGFRTAKIGPDGQTYLLSGSGLYITDGTPAGTELLTQFSDTALDIDFLHGSVIVLARGSSSQSNLHVVDPLSGVSTVLGTIAHRSGAIPVFGGVANGRIILTAQTPSQAPLLWQTDGTVAGTFQLLFAPSETSRRFIPVGATSTAVYWMYSNVPGPDAIYLYRTDGTASGSFAVTNVMDQYGGSIIYNDELYYFANQGFWKANGPMVGATRIATLPAGVFANDLVNAIAANLNGFLYFFGPTGVPGQNGMWRTDGTEVGTQLIMTIANSLPKVAVSAGGRLYFDSGSDLYSTDGTQEGTAIETGAAANMLTGHRAALADAIIGISTFGRRSLLRISPSSRGTISGVVYHDHSHDGERDLDEPGLSMHTVYVDLNANDQLDADEPTQFTDGTGAYRFGGLQPGTYRVAQVLPDGWSQTGSPGDVAIGSSGVVTNANLGASTALSSTVPILLRGGVRTDRAGTPLELRMSEDIGTVNSSMLQIRNVATNTAFPLDPANVVITNEWNRIDLALTSLALMDGNYLLEISAAAIQDRAGTPLASDLSLSFFILAGDANRDRRVDLQDLMILANNWQGTGKTFSQGDFNYDGVVNSADLGILATRWQGTLSPPVAAEAVPTAAKRTPVRTPTRISSQILT